ncbi:MAG: heme ABC exporter ATP-binding protein CcmA [Rhodospirillales bacterium]|nr:MAG: heme ABC exporter ATP-binding protein CcmA [Rhodospirillales bacterium]
MPLFAGHHLTCIRGERMVFRDVSFALEPGGLLLLVGANGSGKTSLLRIMAGLTPAAAGMLSWNDLDISREPEAFRSRLRYVGHLDGVKPALTVAEHLQFWSALLAADSARPIDPAPALEAFGIGHLADLPGRFLSAGQRRRLALARLLLVPAPLWLLDEPRTALDAEAVARLDAVIGEHRLRGGAVVMSSHAGDRPREAAVLDLDAAAGVAVAETWTC